MSCHRYSSEEKQFFIEYVPGHSYREIQEEFIQRFGWEITLSQIKGSIARYKLNTGRSGCFEKGRPSYNKGKKGLRFPGSEKGWFQKGHLPKNYRPVGSERISKDGYVEVKVADPKTWKFKHRVIWEQVNGPVPKGCCLIFLDGNKQNITLDNLMLVNRNTEVRMNQNELFFEDAELTKAGVHIAMLINATGNMRRRKKAANDQGQNRG